MSTIYQGKKSFTLKEFHRRTCCFYDIYRINFNPFLEVRCHFRPTLSYSGLHIGLTEMAKDEVIKGLYNCLLKKRDVLMSVPVQGRSWSSIMEFKKWSIHIYKTLHIKILKYIFHSFVIKYNIFSGYK